MQEQVQYGHNNEVASKVQILQSSINLCSRMPPSKLKKNVVGLINLAPEIQDNLLQSIDQPLEYQQSDPSGPFLKSEFNRDGDSYRSPYTNQYYPSTVGYRPAGLMRKLEQEGGILFRQYTKLYYGSDCLSNFYVAEGRQPGCFSCGFFAKKRNDEDFSGCWDSFNIVNIKMQGNHATYYFISTVLLEMQFNQEALGGIDLTGFIKKQQKIQKSYPAEMHQEQIFLNHLVVIGQTIETIETDLRLRIEGVYFSKAKSTVFDLRILQTVEAHQHKYKLAQDLKNLKLNSAH